MYSLGKIIIGLLFFSFFLILGYLIKNDLFYAIWHTVFILSFYGQVIFYQYSDGTIHPLLANAILLAILFGFSLLKLPVKIRELKIKNPSKILLIISLFLLVPVILKYYSYVNIKTLLFQDIYETRLFFRTFDDKYFGYLRVPLSRVVLPTIMILSIKSKKFFYAVLAIAMILFIYTIGGLKSVFVGMLASLLFMNGKDFISKVFIVLYLFLFLNFFGLLVFTFDNTNTMLIDAFVRRTLFIPPLIDNIYYSFFEETPLLWSHNIIGNLFFEYPLDRPLNMFVGEVLMNKEGMSANVGLITEGYVSFGYFGVFLHSLFIGLFFLLLKSFRIESIFFGHIFVFIYYINTSFFTILMVTHGGLFFLVFAYFFLNKLHVKKRITTYIK
jgi:hypothetical protein